jgi:hypothetical protein
LTDSAHDDDDNDDNTNNAATMYNSCRRARSLDVIVVDIDNVAIVTIIYCDWFSFAAFKGGPHGST